MATATELHATSATNSVAQDISTKGKIENNEFNDASNQEVRALSRVYCLRATTFLAFFSSPLMAGSTAFFLPGMNVVYKSVVYDGTRAILNNFFMYLTA